MIQDIHPHKLENAFLRDAVPAPDDPVFAFRGQEIGLVACGEEITFPRVKYFPENVNLQFLFTLDGKNCFMLMPGFEVPEGLTYLQVRTLREDPRSPRHVTFAAYTALHLASWYRGNAYCGTCGSRTEPGKTERSLICSGCGRTIYPRINPAVIVGVINGDQLLHTKYARGRGVSFYALVAGFSEIGETLEETVEREVFEETGLRVKNIRYYKSQPWGIADDLLAGFYCDVDDSAEVSIDTDELSEAVWIRREDIVGQPSDASLTHNMMITFREGKEPR
ncbi:MAG: NAD(+) diphosphatase [Lachnospiraceae bacterium]|nr:NAD(+) diphosphatase [Lachnospiraceae bacterium]